MQAFNRWMYRGGRPNGLAKFLNRISAWQFAKESTPAFLDTLEIAGRVSGKAVRMPIVIVEMGEIRYIVSMLGENTNWIRNLRAADGRAALLKGGRSPVTLVEVPLADRPAILKRYCQIAPAGRSHLPVSDQASLEEFATIAGAYPVFLVASQP